MPVWHGQREILGFRVRQFAYLTDCSGIPDASCTDRDLCRYRVCLSSRLHPAGQHTHGALLLPLALPVDVFAASHWHPHRPLALAGNVARIVSVGAAAALFGEKTAEGLYHDYSGYVFYLTAVALMLAADRALNRDWRTLLPRARPPAGRR